MHFAGGRRCNETKHFIVSEVHKYEIEWNLIVAYIKWMKTMQMMRTVTEMEKNKIEKKFHHETKASIYDFQQTATIFNS